MTPSPQAPSLRSAQALSRRERGFCDTLLVIDGTLVKVLAWYDNEWGYVNRMTELVRKIADLGV